MRNSRIRSFRRLAQSFRFIHCDVCRVCLHFFLAHHNARDAYSLCPLSTATNLTGFVNWRGSRFAHNIVDRCKHALKTKEWNERECRPASEPCVCVYVLLARLNKTQYTHCPCTLCTAFKIQFGCLTNAVAWHHSVVYTHLHAKRLGTRHTRADRALGMCALQISSWLPLVALQSCATFGARTLA